MEFRDKLYFICTTHNVIDPRSTQYPDEMAKLTIIHLDPNNLYNTVRPRIKICMVQVTPPTLNLYPPVLNFFLQILKLEENSRTKLFCSAILFQIQNLEKRNISK